MTTGTTDGRSRILCSTIAIAGDRVVTNLFLQKIVYFCHVWSLIDLGRPIVGIKLRGAPHNWQPVA